MKRIAAFIFLVFLAACDVGPATLDTKNAKTFITSLDEITVDMSESRRVEFAASILTIYENNERDGIVRLSRLDSLKRDAAVLFNEEGQGFLAVSRSKIASEIVLKVGPVLADKSVAEAIEMATVIYTAAVERHKVDRTEKLTKALKDYAERLAGAEQQLSEAEANLLVELQRQEDARQFLAKVHIKDATFAIKKGSNGKLRSYLSSKGKLVNGTTQKIQQVLGKLVFKDAAGDLTTDKNVAFGKLDLGPNGEVSIEEARMHWRAPNLVPKGYTFSENPADYEISYVIEKVTLLDGTQIAVTDGWQSPEDMIEKLEKTRDFRLKDRDLWIERIADAELEIKTLQQ